MSETYNMDKTATGKTFFQTSVAPAGVTVSRPSMLAIAALYLVGVAAMPLNTHKEEVKNNPDLLKFKCSINNNQFEEIIA